MTRKKSSFHVSKAQVMELLEKRAGIGFRELECQTEAAAVLVCWGAYMNKPDSTYDPQRCLPAEDALRRCENSMGNSVKSKLRKDLQRSLVFQMLRLSNFKKIQ